MCQILRFPGFSGEWGTHRLSDYAIKITKKNKDNAISNVLCNSASLGIIPQSEYFERDIANLDNTASYYIIESGDFVYNPRKSVTAPYGPVNLYNGIEPGIISPLYLCFKVENISKEFLLHWFKGYSWHRYVYSYGDTGVRYDRVSIKDDIFLDMPISLPSNDEQNKISKLLSLLDERIALQSKLIDRLKSLMAGIRQLLFQKSTSYQSLGNIVDIRKGKQINGSELLDCGEYPVMNGGISPSGFLNEYNTPAGTISISEGGNSCGYVQFNYTPIWSGGHCYTLHLIGNDMDNRYLYHFLKHSESDIMKLRIGSGLPNIQKKDLSRFLVASYPISDQKKITKILDAIEEKIFKEELILQSCTKQKTYLLSAIFI